MADPASDGWPAGKALGNAAKISVTELCQLPLLQVFEAAPQGRKAHMSYSQKMSLKEVIEESTWGSTIGVMKGDIVSLDYSSYAESGLSCYST